ncbi:hypothetical protein [Streptomyces sp. NBC_00009]|uniref:hypothetical protein n=1 Tax=Streptomyces sp. NBC_00009 TaxID=2975620 RepID=UPI00324FD024
MSTVRRSTPLSRALASAAVLSAVAAVGCAVLRHGAPRPRWDVLGCALAALALAAAWRTAARLAPPCATDPAGVPAPPARFARPVLGWVPALAVPAMLLLPWAAVVFMKVPGGAEHGEQVAAIQRAGAAYASGFVVDLEDPDYSESGESAEWYADTEKADPSARFVVEFQPPGRDDYVQAPASVVAPGRHVTDRDFLALLYAPDRTDLGFYALDLTPDNMKDLKGLVAHGGLDDWIPPRTAQQAVVVLPVVFVLILVLVPRRLDAQERRLEQDAARGTVRALRVRVGAPVWDGGPRVELHTEDGATLALLPRRRCPATPAAHQWTHRSLLRTARAFRDQEGWLCLPVDVEPGETPQKKQALQKPPVSTALPAALVTDTGHTIWGSTPRLGDTGSGTRLVATDAARRALPAAWHAPSDRTLFRTSLLLAAVGVAASAPQLVGYPDPWLACALSVVAMLALFAFLTAHVRVDRAAWVRRSPVVLPAREVIVLLSLMLNQFTRVIDPDTVQEGVAVIVAYGVLAVALLGAAARNRKAAAKPAPVPASVPPPASTPGPSPDPGPTSGRSEHSPPRT